MANWFANYSTSYGQLIRLAPLQVVSATPLVEDPEQFTFSLTTREFDLQFLPDGFYFAGGISSRCSQIPKDIRVRHFRCYRGDSTAEFFLIPIPFLPGTKEFGDFFEQIQVSFSDYRIEVRDERVFQTLLSLKFLGASYGLRQIDS